MKKFLAWLKNEESGQGMVEYGLIVALIVVIIVGVIAAFRGKIENLFGGIGNKIEEQTNNLIDTTDTTDTAA